MKIAIIGGGAAGLMAAAALAESDKNIDVVVLEKNDLLGNKVLISGGGRCNVTTGLHDIPTVLEHYPRGKKFLTKAMYAFPPKAMYDWVEDHGVPLKTEADNRVFPKSNNGKDIVHIFEKIFTSKNVRVQFNAHVTAIKKTEHEFEITLKNSKTPITADCVIITTGGQAYRQTGSTGDGYAFAQSLGHTITQLAPSLSALNTQERWPADVSGLSFQHARLSVAHQKAFTTIGPVLFTHKGISGPGVFAFSSRIAFEPFNANEPLQVFIDLNPDQQTQVLFQTIQRTVENHPKKSLLNAISTLLPKSFAQIALDELKLPSDAPANEISKKDIRRFADWIKNIPLHINARSAGEEFVTAGGVELKEVDPSTMESKICPSLYLAGEILNIDGFTGGFNLQSAWATGYLAGTSIAQTIS